MKSTKYLLLGIFLINSTAFADMADQGGLGAGLKLPSNLDFSVFGTAGYAISDKPYAYKYGTISEHGSFNADSNLGLQVDWQINSRLSAVVQGELAPSRDKDHRWRTNLTWAQLAYRINSNWVVRLGRARLPAFLYTQNSNVGLSYYAARLPVEVYDLSPTYQYNGVSSTYVWDVGDDGMQTIAWDVYAGYSNFPQRIWMRDTLGSVSAGANTFSRRLTGGGTFVTYEDSMENNRLRAGLHYVLLKDRNGNSFLKRHNVIVLPNGAEVYPPVGTNTTDHVKYALFTLMADWHLGKGVYLASELGVRRALNVNSGLNSYALYVHARKRFGDFTPYVAWSFSQSDSKSRSTYKALSKPTGLAQYDLLNRISGDALLMANQSTISLGTAYDIGMHHRLKLEYARTRIGRGDYLIDRRLLDGDLDGEYINIFTASYSFLF